MESVIFAVISFNGKYDFLSNFYPHPVEIDEIVYPSVEFAYQAAKTDDIEIKKKIAKMPSPGKAKQFGSELKQKRNWNKIKLDVMFNLLVEKFKDEELQEKLLNTGDAVLVEGNWWGDTYWGCITRSDNELFGQNNLGKSLMKVREYYRTFN